MTPAESIAGTLVCIAAIGVLAAAAWLVRYHWRDVIGGLLFAAACWGWLTYGAAFLHAIGPEPSPTPRLTASR